MAKKKTDWLVATPRQKMDLVVRVVQLRRQARISGFLMGFATATVLFLVGLGVYAWLG